MVVGLLGWGSSLGAIEGPFTDNVSALTIHALADSPKIKSIESLLHSLSKTNPGYLREFTLLSKAHPSRQDGDEVNPRAVIYGSRATLTMTFNGSPDQEGYGLLEMMQFYAPTATFEFYEVSTKPNGGLDFHRGEGCTICHQKDARPNWMPYSDWPGAFVGKDDRISEEERVPLQSFIDRAGQHPRYKYLLGLRNRYSPGPEGRVIGRPNAALTERLSQLNFRRLSRILKKTDHYDRYRFAILGSLVCTLEFEEFFPAALRPTQTKWLQFSARAPGRDAAFNYLFDSRQISTKGWSMELPTVHLAEFSEPFATPGNAAYEFAGQLMDADPELAKYGEVESANYLGAALRRGSVSDCDVLKARSRDALTTRY